MERSEMQGPDSRITPRGARLHPATCIGLPAHEDPGERGQQRAALAAGAVIELVTRMERSEMRDPRITPRCARLHPGYKQVREAQR